MNYEDITPTMRAFVGVHEAYRKLGFKSEEIFCQVAITPTTRGLACFATLITQEKDFLAIVGDVPDADVFLAEYEVVAAAINDGTVSQEVLDRIWQESVAYNNKESFITALLSRGFIFPKAVS